MIQEVFVWKLSEKKVSRWSKVYMKQTAGIYHLFSEIREILNDFKIKHKIIAMINLSAMVAKEREFFLTDPSIYIFQWFHHFAIVLFSLLAVNQT